MKTYLSITVLCFAVLFNSCGSEKNEKKIKKPKNIILMIGDGMGLGQIQAAMTVNKGNLYFLKFPVTGLQKTSSADNYITDSGASATALATGKKTKNYSISVDINKIPVKTILEIAEDNGLSTGLIATSSITHATPACFFAHQPNRNMQEEIAVDLLKTDIDVVIGGGLDYFANRSDSVDLTENFKNKGYGVYTNLDSISSDHEKLVVLTAPDHNKKMSEGRGNMLSKATKEALKILSKNKKGFFLMIEGSHIDWGCHANNQQYVVDEIMDFNNVVRLVEDFSKKNGETLIIVTADHETGGMVVVNGDYKNGYADCVFANTNHTGTMVPVFAIGPGAFEFTGVYENTDIFYKMKNLLGL